jgi:ABC-2 type transport system permease protein
MMRHTLLVFLYELRRNFRRKGYLLTTFGVPVLVVALMLILQRVNLSGTGTQEQIVEAMDNAGIQKGGYVDETGIFADEELTGDLANVLTSYPNEEAARAALDAGEIEAYYVIPADYMETGDVSLVLPRMSVTEISEGPIQQLILTTLSKGADDAVVTRILDPSNIQQTNLAITNAQAGSGEDAEDANFALVYVFALALLLSLFFTNGYLMQSVIEEKETRLIEILISTVRPMQLLMGKILAMGLLGLLQILVWVGGMFLALRLISGDQANMALGFLASLASVQIPVGILPLLVVYFLLSYTLFASMYAIVGALSNSMREGPQYAVFFTLPAVVPLYFITVFATSPDASLATILSLIPITAPLAMTMRMLVSSVPAEQILLSLALLALSVVFAMWLAGRLFRVQTLLAGQMPKLRDLPKLVKG